MCIRLSVRLMDLWGNSTNNKKNETKRNETKFRINCFSFNHHHHVVVVVACFVIHEPVTFGIVVILLFGSWTSIECDVIYNFRCASIILIIIMAPFVVYFGRSFSLSNVHLQSSQSVQSNEFKPSVFVLMSRLCFGLDQSLAFYLRLLCDRKMDDFFLLQNGRSCSEP